MLIPKTLFWMNFLDEVDFLQTFKNVNKVKYQMAEVRVKRLSKKEMLEKHFRVAIFGSARIKKGDKTFKLVYKLARMIANEGIDIVTGGGPGLMDAASRGHHMGNLSHDSHSIGLTIRLPREQKEAYHLEIKKDFDKFSSRLDYFMYLSNVVVVAPGGVGTMLEFLYTWQLVQVHKICEIPIILLGEQWKGLLEWIKEHPLKKNLISKKDLSFIYPVNTCEEAMRLIKKAHEIYKKGRSHICRELKKFKA